MGIDDVLLDERMVELENTLGSRNSSLGMSEKHVIPKGGV